MNQNSVKTIGIKDESRKDSYLVYVNQANGLKASLVGILKNGQILIVGRLFQFSNGFFLEL